MKVRRLDENHDFTFGNGLANYALTSEAIKQCAVTILLSFRYNWHLDEDHGINWWAYYVKNPNVSIMEDDIKRHILEVEGVASLQDLNLQLNTITRKMTIIVKYTDIYSNSQVIIEDVINYR